MDTPLEPWLRGPIPEVNPLTAPVLYAFQKAREDLAKYTGGLTGEQIWATPHGMVSVGFHHAILPAAPTASSRTSKGNSFQKRSCRPSWRRRNLEQAVRSYWRR
jgi:hypothetical protein